MIREVHNQLQNRPKGVDAHVRTHYNIKVINRAHSMPQDEFLARFVIDPMRKTFYMYSDQGDEKVLSCDTIDEFMNVLEFVNSVVPDEMIAYSDPMIPA